MSTKTQEQVLTMDLREALKAIMRKEIDRLPETLEALEPKERLNIICRLMPYIFPKVTTVHPTEGEPFKVF
jgi:hypothetical protein